MAYSVEQRRALLEASLPERQAVRQRVQDYMARSGLALSDLAHRVGYARCTLHFFMHGQYHKVSSNDSALRARLTDFMNTHPVGTPGNAAGKLYETANVRSLRAHFRDALDHHRAVYVEGGPGTQKSFTGEHLIAELNRAEISKNGSGRRAYLVYCRQGIGPLDLLKRIAEAAGTPGIGGIDRILRNLRFDFHGCHVLLWFDEAQHLSVECFEIIRELLDRPPHFALLFTGSHALKSFFVRNAIQLEQWRSRFHKGESLPGLSEAEARAIVAAESGGRIGGKAADRLIKGSLATALWSSGERQYISARSLFNALAELKGKLEPAEPVPSGAGG